MLLIGGVDPGVNGAVGVYDFDADKLVAVYKLPSYTVIVGRSERTRLDEEAVDHLFKALAMMGVVFCGIENVQGGNFRGKKQSASSGFQFGYTFGVLRMACVSNGIKHTAASPAVWKMVEQVPDNAKGIIAKADAEFPEHKAAWHGPKGGLLHDIAEAAFISRYFARRIWPSHQQQEGLRSLAIGIGKKVDGIVPNKPATAVGVALTGKKRRKKK